eukprot:32333_2
MVFYAHVVYVTCYFCYMFSLGPSSGSSAVFGYIEGSFLVSRTGDAHEHHVPNIYRCMSTVYGTRNC